MKEDFRMIKEEIRGAFANKSPDAEDSEYSLQPEEHATFMSMPVKTFLALTTRIYLDCPQQIV